MIDQLIAYMQPIMDEHPDMTIYDFTSEIVKVKSEFKVTWNDIKDYVNNIFGVDYSLSWYKKYFTCTHQSTNISSTQDQTLLDIKKERVKLSDERIQNNAYVRKLAREETLIEIADKLLDKLPITRFLTPIVDNHKFENINLNTSNEGILCLSDWHYGITCNNHWNIYDTDIAKIRLSRLRDQVLNYCKFHNVKTLHILNLGDLIAGRIHLAIRLESRIDVITQILEVTELLSEFLLDINNYVNVEYYSCSDNHSRLEPNKSDSLELESLYRITDYFLAKFLGEKIKIHTNTYGDDIITFNCMGYKILGLHGDKDKPAQIIDSISRMTEDHYDLICTAHLHHFSCEEKNNTVIVGNGSLMGVDTYAKNLRLSSKPSQNLIIVTKQSVCDCIHRILV